MREEKTMLDIMNELNNRYFVIWIIGSFFNHVIYAFVKAANGDVDKQEIYRIIKIVKNQDLIYIDPHYTEWLSLSEFAAIVEKLDNESYVKMILEKSK